MSMFARLAALARSPQGRRMMKQASTYAKSPEGRKKIQGVVETAKSRRPGARSPAKKRARW